MNEKPVRFEWEERQRRVFCYNSYARQQTSKIGLPVFYQLCKDFGWIKPPFCDRLSTIW